MMLNKLFGTRIKVVSGYKGGNDVYLAMERGEVARPLRRARLLDQFDRPDWFPQKKVACRSRSHSRAIRCFPTCRPRADSPRTSAPDRSCSSCRSAGHGSADPGAARRSGDRVAALRGAFQPPSTIPVSRRGKRQHLEISDSTATRSPGSSTTPTRCPRKSCGGERGREPPSPRPRRITDMPASRPLGSSSPAAARSGEGSPAISLRDARHCRYKRDHRDSPVMTTKRRCRSILAGTCFGN